MQAQIIDIKPHQIQKRIDQLDEDLDHQVNMWAEALIKDRPTKELSDVMVETETEIHRLERKL